jgi:tetratricopeptide (TPR) repeat protein
MRLRRLIPIMNSIHPHHFRVSSFFIWLPLAGTVAALLSCAATVNAIAQTATRSPLVARLDSPPDRDLSAKRALLEGRVDEAEEMLQAILAQAPADAAAHQLLCRTYYVVDKSDRAVHECELATTADPRSSDNFLWLGRAYGQKAGHANPLAAFSLARKAHAAFETAAQLDPANQEALGDLGEYYVQAPAIVGGGNEKARTLAAHIMPQFPSAAHGILAVLAESDKDASTAEQEFKLTISTAKGPEAQANAWIDLAGFYQKHNRPDQAAAAAHTGIALDRTHGPVLVHAAKVLTAAHREPALAERCLREYLESHAQTDSAPAFKVHLQLARLLAARGESAEATREVQIANSLAPGSSTATAAQDI